MWSRYSATTHGVFTVARASHLPYLPYKPYVPYQSYLSDSGDREDREGREDREDHGDTETFQKRIKKENNITSSSPPLSTATGIPSQTSTIPYHTISMVDSVACLCFAECSRAPSYITNGYGCPMQTTTSCTWP